MAKIQKQTTQNNQATSRERQKPRTRLEELESRRQHLSEEEERVRRRERSQLLRLKNRLRSVR